MSDLTMQTFLEAVRTYSTKARNILVDAGYHPREILAKAEKAANQGYTDYGVVPDRPWLTDKGLRFVEDA